MLLIFTLTEHCAYSVVACIAHDLETKFPIGRLNDGCGNECLLEGIEGYEAFLVKVERGILCQQVGQGSGYTGEVLDEPPVETSMTQETPESLDISRGWQLFDSIDLCPIHFYPSLRHSMPENNSFPNHEVTLFPFENFI